MMIEKQEQSIPPSARNDRASRGLKSKQPQQGVISQYLEQKRQRNQMSHQEKIEHYKQTLNNISASK